MEDFTQERVLSSAKALVPQGYRPQGSDDWGEPLLSGTQFLQLSSGFTLLVCLFILFHYSFLVVIKLASVERRSDQTVLVADNSAKVNSTSVPVATTARKHLITSSYYRTIRHLLSSDGLFSPFRGFQSWCWYYVLYGITRLMSGYYIPLRALPVTIAGETWVIPEEFLRECQVTLVLLPLDVCYSHVVVSKTRKPFRRRLGSVLSGKDNLTAMLTIVAPVTLFSLALRTGVDRVGKEIINRSTHFGVSAAIFIVEVIIRMLCVVLTTRSHMALLDPFEVTVVLTHRTPLSTTRRIDSTPSSLTSSPSTSPEAFGDSLVVNPKPSNGKLPRPPKSTSENALRSTLRMLGILFTLVLIDLLALVLLIGGIIYAVGLAGSAWTWFRTFRSGDEIKFEAGFDVVLQTLARPQPIEPVISRPALRIVEREL